MTLPGWRLLAFLLLLCLKKWILYRSGVSYVGKHLASQPAASTKTSCAAAAALIWSSADSEFSNIPADAVSKPLCGVFLAAGVSRLSARSPR